MSKNASFASRFMYGVRWICALCLTIALTFGIPMQIDRQLTKRRVARWPTAEAIGVDCELNRSRSGVKTDLIYTYVVEHNHTRTTYQVEQWVRDVPCTEAIGKTFTVHYNPRRPHQTVIPGNLAHRYSTLAIVGIPIFLGLGTLYEVMEQHIRQRETVAADEQ